MKPFDLQAALAGKPVVTRGGKQVLAIHKMPHATKFNVVVTIEGRDYPLCTNENGRYLVTDSVEHQHDLFMVPEVRYVNVWHSPGREPWCGSSHTTRHGAEVAADSYSKLHPACKVVATLEYTV